MPLRIFGLSILAAATLLAQSPAPGPVREQATVSLVEVPVTVLDSNGKPVRGLTAADFTVTDDGHPVKLVGVDVQEFASPRTSDSTPQPAPPAERAVLPAARRRFLLLFDLSFATAAEITRVREAGRRFVSEQLGPSDLAAVGTFSLLHGFRMIVTFTPDRLQLAAAVDTLGLGDTLTRAGDPLNLSAFIETSLFDTNGSATTGGKMNEALRENARQLQETLHGNDLAYRREQATSLIRSFGTLARVLSSVEGRKQIIYFSEGFDSRLLQGNASDRQDPTQLTDSNPTSAASQAELSVHGMTWEVDSQSRFGDSSLQTNFNSLLELFQRSDCVVHSVDLAGLTAGGSSPGSLGKSGQDTLFAMARGTGGELFKSANDFSAQLDRLLQKQSVVYVLAFSPSPTGHPAKFHTLKVKVARSGSTISARAGYYEPKPYASESVVEQNLTAADVIASEIPVHDLPAEVSAVPFAAAKDARVPVIVRIPASALLANGPTGKLPIEIYGYAFDEKGRIADFFTEKAILDLAQVHQKIEAGGVLFYAALQVRPGNYRIRVLVRNGSSGEMGLTVSQVMVPDYSGGKLQLTRPLFVGETPDAVVLRGRSALAIAAGGGEEPFAFIAGKGSFLPRQPANFARNSEVEVCLYAYHIGAGTDGGVKLVGQVMDSDEKVLSPASLALEGVSKPDTNGRATYLLNLKIGDLSPGSYGLRLILQDPTSGDARQSTAPFAVN